MKGMRDAKIFFIGIILLFSSINGFGAVNFHAVEKIPVIGVEEHGVVAWE